MSLIWCSHGENSDTCQECKHESYLYKVKYLCGHCDGTGGLYPNHRDKYEPCPKNAATYDTLWVKCFICKGTGKKK